MLEEHGAAAVRWAQVKDDITPQQIFDSHRGTNKDRAMIAKYCLQDCDLVMELFNKLDVLNNAFAMANVCSVPVGYIFTRGQGIKIESLIFKYARSEDKLMHVLPSASHGDDSDDPSYEGAIVLEPKTGIYIDQPVTALDFSSLYPSTIISENISHDTLISLKETKGSVTRIIGGSDKFDNLPGAKYVDIEYDLLVPDPDSSLKHPPKVKMGTRVARYIQVPVKGRDTVGNEGMIPKILKMLLSSRKAARKEAEKEPDEFKRALLDAKQLAYKLTANSLYGQLGSNTFKVRRQELAASTTAYGRRQLMFAKDCIERVYGDKKDSRCNAEYVYGDTDSVFISFNPKDPMTGELLHGAAALAAAKSLTEEAGKLVTGCLRAPHDFEFDKIFRTFCLLSKKRYVGDMSEGDLDDFHRKAMGIVMKRRDNAPIVKYIYGGAIDRILDPLQGIRSAFTFVQETAKALLQEKLPMSKLTITKSLKSEYKLVPAHKMLANRIAERDPGNAPSTTERIPFVYILPPPGEAPSKLQGDRIETPSYIKEKKLKIDYPFYITNQIAKPVAQVFGLEVEKLPGVTKAALAATVKAKDPVAARESLAESLLFGKLLVEAAQAPETMERRGQKSILSFLK
jgi:DNA polymerase delta subunit 1